MCQVRGQCWGDGSLRKEHEAPTFISQTHVKARVGGAHLESQHWGGSRFLGLAG